MTDRTDAQPISTVAWVPREMLTANSYNPNHVAPPELKLLKLSILEDGWTQPIVARPDHVIVDGFHRWTVSADPEVAALTDGLVPVVYLHEADAAHLRMSTIRHNRARGEHIVVKMADIVAELLEDNGLTDEEIQRRLGMEREEVLRLADRGDMTRRGSRDRFGQALVPGEKP